MQIFHSFRPYIYSQLYPFIFVQIVSLPTHLPYTYSIQFMEVRNENDENLDSETRLIICDANTNFDGCNGERYRIPILNRILPQTISFRLVNYYLF